MVKDMLEKDGAVDLSPLHCIFQDIVEILFTSTG